MSNTNPGRLRIIAGKWRGRKINFPTTSQIRPTPDSVRETLFNWLTPGISNARCLDLFSGSGALGFEALSRGAAHVVMVDKSTLVVERLKENAYLLGANHIEILCATFPERLNKVEGNQFDVVFLDPPFNQGLIEPCCLWLEEKKCLSPNALIYIEAEKTLTPLPIPTHWEIIREKTAGQVSYYLVRCG